MRLPPPSVKVCAAVLAVAFASWPAWAQAPVGQQTQRVAENMSRVLFWCAVLVGAALLLALIFLLIRKRLASMDDESPTMGNPMGFTLADLRQMHAEGQISDEEFDFAKRKMAARAKAQLDPTAEDDEPEFIDLGDGLTPPTPPAAPRADKPGGPDDPEAPPADKIDGPDDPPPPPPGSPSGPV